MARLIVLLVALCCAALAPRSHAAALAPAPLQLTASPATPPAPPSAAATPAPLPDIDTPTRAGPTPTELFVHATEGSDRNDGSAGSPLQTLTAAQLRADSNCIINLAGHFRGQPFRIVNKSHVTLRQWEGQDKCVVDGSTPFEHLEPVGGSIYTFAAKPGLNVKGLVWRWHQNVNAQGHHYGHLPPASTAATVGPAGYWHYDSETGVFTVDTAGRSTDPADWAWIRGGNGVEFNQCTDITVNGLTVQLFAERQAGSGLGLVFYACRDSTASNCEVWDCGYHNISGQGQQSVNIVFRDCVVGGGSARFGHSGTLGVFHGTNVDVSGCLMENVRFEGYSLLLDAATPLDAGIITSMYWHTGGQGRLIRGVTLLNCTFNGYEHVYPGLQNPVCTGQTTAYAADPLNGDAYAVRVIGCTFNNASVIANTLDAKAFIRCRFNMRTNAGMFLSVPSRFQILGGGRLYMEACEILSENHAVGSRIWQVSGTLVLKNNIIIADEPAGTGRPFINGAPSTVIRAYGNVFARAATGPLYLGSAPVDPGRLTFLGNRYVGIGVGSFGPGTDLNDMHEWQAAYDAPEAGGSYEVTALNAADTLGLADRANFDLTPTPDGWLRATVHMNPVHTMVGINGLLYDGRYGAWQWTPPACRADLNNDGTLSVADFSAFRNAYLASDIAADFNDDGALSTSDFAAFRNAYLAGCP